MKIVKILSAFAAVCALVIGCAKETLNFLDEIQVSSSYVGLPTDGGSSTITVTATDSWSIDTENDWLTISPKSGSAGETPVTFTAEKASETRVANIKIVCSGKEQLLRIMQQAEAGEPEIIGCKQAVDLIKAGTQGSKTYYIKGIVCALVDISVQYGNATFWMSDNGVYNEKDGQNLQVYRSTWLNGGKITTGDEIAVGDEIVVSGCLIDYKGTPETQEKTTTVISINKSLIKCDSLVFNGAKVEDIPLEGGAFSAMLMCKGNGVSVSVPDDAKSWLSVTGVKTGDATAVVDFYAAKNNGGDRSTELTFTTSDGSKNYSAKATVSQKGAILDVSIAEFNAALKSSIVYRISGFVTKVDDASKGNFHLKDYSAETYVYKAANFADYSTLKVGDLVTIIGNRDEYGTTIELTNGKIEDVKTVTVKTVAEADALDDDDKNDPKNYIMITGTVKDGSAKSGHKFDLTNYGNFDLVDETGEIYVYGVSTGWKGAKGNGAFATLGVKEGDKITIVAYKTSYNGMNQLVGYYYSHEKGGAPEPVEVTEYSIDLPYEGADKFYDDGVATINGEENQKVLKIGTSSATGSVTFTVPAGSKKVTTYAIAWKGKATTLEFKVGDTVVGTQEIADNDGASNNSPYTITVTDSDKYTIDLGDALTADTKVTITTAAGANTRAIFFGVKAVK